MFNSIIESTTTGLSMKSGFICMVVSIILGIIIALVHKNTSKYSKNFLITLGILPLLVQAVIMLVNGNLGTSVAILGAFSLVRFRSLPGNSKEIMSVFFAMVVGLAVGVGCITFAICLTIIASILIIVLSKSSFGNQNEKMIKLKITIPENLDYTEIFDDVFSKYLKKYDLEKVKTTNMGSMYELLYNIQINNNINEKEFIDELRVKNGNLPIVLQRETTGEFEL